MGVIILFVLCFQATYFCSGRSVGIRECGREHGDGSNFSENGSNDLFFNIGMEACRRGLIVCFVVCFRT